MEGILVQFWGNVDFNTLIRIVPNIILLPYVKLFAYLLQFGLAGHVPDRGDLLVQWFWEIKHLGIGMASATSTDELEIIPIVFRVLSIHVAVVAH